MCRKWWPFLTLVLVTLNAGAAFAQVLELPGKMRLAGRDYLLVRCGRRWRTGSVSAAECGLESG